MNTHETTNTTTSSRTLANQSIMVAVNGGPSGWSALEWAAAEASTHHSDLRIMHAISWPRLGLDPIGQVTIEWWKTSAPESGSLILAEAARRAHVAAPLTTITTHLEAGETAATILRAGGSDMLIVVGSRQTRWRTRRSVVSVIARLAKGPIAIVRTPSTTERRVNR